MSVFISLDRACLNMEIFDHQSLRLFRRRTVGPNTKLLVRQDRVVVTALDKISLRFQEGDRVAVMGRNGSGKSTLLKTIAGIYEPTDGSRIVGGGRVTFLDSGFFARDDLTGYECIDYYCLLRQLRPEQCKEVREDVENFADLGEFLNCPLRSYSTGMRVRLTATLVTSLPSEILCIDEGIGAVDEFHQERFRVRLESHVSNAKIIVVASHDYSLLQRLCSTGIVLENGKVVAKGSLEECYERYKEGHDR
jgi:ABC-type polysaccharide/polyol phosphate transport system ATPase subunit